MHKASVNALLRDSRYLRPHLRIDGCAAPWTLYPAASFLLCSKHAAFHAAIEFVPGAVETLCGKDVNDLFSVSLPKETRIKDARLALLTYGVYESAHFRKLLTPWWGVSFLLHYLAVCHIVPDHVLERIPAAAGSSRNGPPVPALSETIIYCL